MQWAKYTTSSRSLALLKLASCRAKWTAASSPLRAAAEGTRGDGGGEFRLDESKGPGAHVYLYFEREDGTAWSPSRHFRVE